MTEPDSSPAAHAASLLVMAAILVSTAAFCLETLPEFSEERGPAAYEWVQGGNRRAAKGRTETLDVQGWGGERITECMELRCRVRATCLSTPCMRMACRHGVLLFCV